MDRWLLKIKKAGCFKFCDKNLFPQEHVSDNKKSEQYKTEFSKQK